MKKKLLLLLFSAALSFSFVVPVSAAPPNPTIPDLDAAYEPGNNDYVGAPTLFNGPYWGSGRMYQGHFQHKNDLDAFRFKTEGGLMQTISFFPPDNQKYYLAIFEVAVLENGGTKGVTSHFFETGEPETFEFLPKADTEYVIYAMPWNITSTPVDPYYIWVNQYR